MSIIENGLRADIMRKRMEDKNTLQYKGSLYVGTNNGTDNIQTSDNSLVGIFQGEVGFFPITYFTKINYQALTSARADKLQSFENSFQEVKYIWIHDTTALGGNLYKYTFICSPQDNVEIKIQGQTALGNAIQQTILGIPSTDILKKYKNSIITQTDLAITDVWSGQVINNFTISLREDQQVIVSFTMLNFPLLSFKYRILK